MSGVGPHQVLLYCRGPKKEEVAADSAGVDGAANVQQSTEPESRPPDSKPVAVLFGTEYGFSKEIAEKAAGQLKGTGKYW